MLSSSTMDKVIYEGQLRGPHGLIINIEANTAEELQELVLKAARILPKAVEIASYYKAQKNEVPSG